LRGGKVHRIQRQVALKTLDKIDEEKTEDTQRYEGRRIAHPGLFFILANAADAVNEPFNRAKYRMKEGPLPFKHAVHKRSDWLGNRDDDREENQYLYDAYQCHVETSEFLRSKQGVDQVNEQEGRNDPGDSVFH